MTLLCVICLKKCRIQTKTRRKVLKELKFLRQFFGLSNDCFNAFKSKAFSDNKNKSNNML